MKEDFLHYVWKFQKIKVRKLKTTQGENIHIKSVGQHNMQSGPDFFNAKVTIGKQLWAGNLEIHLKSSNWYEHSHEQDIAYDNVILHVVWEHDAEIFRKDNSVIPTLVLKGLIASETLENYYRLFSKKQLWIQCEPYFAEVNEFTLKHWLDRLYVERLENKSERILLQLARNNNHWEALLFRLLCRNFGSKVNGQSFLSIAESIDFKVVQKCAQDAIMLESILLGQAGLLEETEEDAYLELLRNNYQLLKQKFNLKNDSVVAPRFFRLRPPNFPTIRLSQLARLYASERQLFSKIIANTSEVNSEKTIQDIYKIFSVSASEYWDDHFNFGLVSAKRTKRLTHNFIDLLLINTIIPLKFCYAREQGKEVTESLLELANSITKEENSIVRKFNTLRPVATNALESQALLQLKENYCDKSRCLECAIGNSVLKSEKRK